LAVLCQKPGDQYRPVGCFSTKIPVTTFGHPRCIKALDGATWAVDSSDRSSNFHIAHSTQYGDTAEQHKH